MKKQNTVLRSVLSILLTLCMLCQIMGVSMTAFAAMNTVKGDVVGNLDYTIDNPYKDVDWDTWYQYKGATHVHTHASDGNEDVNEMIEKYYELGYHLLSLTDHGTVNYGWTVSRGRHAMFSYQSFVHGGVDPLSSSRNAQITTGYGREDGIGMIDVPLGIELNGASTKKVHINSYFVDAGDGDMELDADWPSDAIAKSQRAVAPDGGKGVCHINHVGEWSGGNDDVGVYDEDFVNRFAQIFRDYDVCVGMELVNTSDGRTRNDRYLYDKVLMELAPEGKNVFGFCEDDSHEFSDCGRNINYYIMPEQTWQAVRTSMTTGAFFASAQNAKTAEELGSGFVATGEFPRISRINIDEEKDQIILYTKNANKCKMVADGEIIESLNVDTDGEVITLDLNAYEDQIGSYVRVYLTGPGGITYVQPFLLTATEDTSTTLNFEVPYDDFELTLKDSAGNIVQPINSDYYFKVDAGTYYYSVTKFGYTSIVDEPVTISEEQISKGEDVTVNIELQQDTSVSFLYFYVPETIYLDPSDNRTFASYSDRTNTPNGQVNSNSNKTTGNVYFYCKDATDVTITAETEYGTSLFALRFGNSNDTLTISSDTDTVSTAITYGILSEACTTETLIKWTVQYTLSGALLEAYAYSYVYKVQPDIVAAAGGYAKTSKNIVNWAHDTMNVTGTVWLAGIHSVSGGSYAYRFPYYEGASVAGSGTSAITTSGVGMNVTSDDSSGGSVTVNPVGGTGHITIDRSRTTNYGEIPYLSAGLDVNHADDTNGNDCGLLANYINFGENSLYYEDIDKLTLHSGTRLFASDNSVADKAINKAIDVNETKIPVTGSISGGKSDRRDTVNGTVYLQPTFVNKNQLRTLVNNEIMSSKQVFTMANRSDFEEYLAWIMNAYTILGDPTSTQDEIDGAVNSLTSSSEKLENATTDLLINYRFESGTIFKTEETTVELGSMFSFRIPELGGCTFNNWKVYSNLAPFASGTEEDIVVYVNSSNFYIDIFFTAHDYIASFDTLGGEFHLIGGSGINAKYGSYYTLPTSVPEKSGFVFDRWLSDLDGRLYAAGESFVYNYESNALFTAQYKPLVYSVSFDVTGGDTFEPIGGSGDTIDYENSYALPINLPTKPGYNFYCWELDLNGETYSAGQTVTWLFPQSGVFSAIWSPVNYTVCFSGGEGSRGSLDPITTDYDTPFTLPPYGSFLKTGCEQIGWALDDGNKYYAGDSLKSLVSEEGGSITFTAVWGEGAYVVEFDTGVEGLELVSGKVEYLDTYGNLPRPSRIGYTFDGWFTLPVGGEQIFADTVVTLADDHTLYAHWTPEVYTVTLNTGDENLIFEPITVTFDETYSALPDISRTGYDFTGWYLGEEIIDKTSKVTTPSDHTLTASWVARLYVVSFESGIDTELASQTVTFGQKYNDLPELSRENYWFRGWYLDDKLITNDTVVSTAQAHTLTARWDPYVDVTVYFESEENSAFEPIVVTVEKTYGALPVPTREGYAFAGWTVSDTVVDENSVVTQNTDHVLVSSWISNTYTVSFDTQFDNVNCRSIDVKFGEPYGELPVPTMYGYTFDGWTIDGEMITDSSTVSVADNHTLTAEWSAQKFTVSFVTGYSEVTCDSIEVTYNDSYKNLPVPVFPGYVFVGWYYISSKVTDSTVVTLAADHTLTAKWSRDTYAVSFDSDGGSRCDDIAVMYLSTYATLPVPIKTGYTFAGWIHDGNVITSDSIVNVPYAHTLTATWIAQTFDVTFDSNGGSYVRPITVTFGQPYGQLTTPTLEGYSFEGWTVNGVTVDSDTVVSIAENHTLTAVWAELQYSTVTFDTAGGSAVDSIVVAKGEKYGYLETPYRNGYTFDGWYLDGVKIDEYSTVEKSEDHTLTAKWNPVAYTVSFDSNGGTECDPITVYHDGKYIGLPVPTRENYTFDGWYFGDVLVTEGSSLALNLSHDLYALWSPIKVTVSFDSNGGLPCDPIQVSYGYTYTNLPKPTYSGYTFAGWTYNGAIVTNSTRMNIATDHTLVATWVSGKTYTVSFVDNNGITICDPVVVLENEAFYYKLPVPEITGKTFKYWYYGDDYSVPVDESFVYNYGTDITLTAYCTSNKYTVSFDPNGGSVSTPSKNVTYGLRYGTLPTPEFADHDFVGWYYDGTLITNSTTVTIAKDHTLTAVWSSDFVTVSFETGDPAVTLESIYVPIGQRYSSLPTPVRDGFEFAGWTYNDQIVTDSDMLVTEEDHTLRAKWTKLFTITWDIEGEVTVDSLRAGTAITAKDIPEKTGFTAVWDKTVPQTMPEKNLTFTAVYIYIDYTVTWVTDESSIVDKYHYGDPIDVREVPYKNGFEGVWDKQIPAEMPAENLVFTAVYTPVKYTFTWIIEDETIVQEYYFGDEIKPVDLPAKTGNTAKWSSSIPTFMPSANLTVRAVYTPIEYTVTWIVDGTENTNLYYYGDILTAPQIPEKTGMSASWDNVVPDTMPAENLVFTAIYVFNTYSVTYLDIEDSQFTSVAPTSHTYGTDTLIPDVSKEGFVFNGWICNGVNVGTSLTLEATAYTDDIVLTATWTVITCEIVVSTTTGGVVKVYVDDKFVSPENGKITVNYGTVVRLKPVSVCGFELFSLTAITSEGSSYLDGDFTYTVTENVNFKAMYAESDATNFVTVTGGKISGRYRLLVPMYGVVSAIASVPENGMKFSHWAEGSADGQILSYEELYTFISVSDLDLYAVYVTEDTVVEEQPTVATYRSSDTHITELNGLNSYSYYGNIILPENCTLIEAGLLLTNENAENLTDDNFVIGSEKAVTLNSSVINEYGQVKITVNNIQNGQTRVGRFYMTYTDGTQTFTVYSNTWSVLSTEA